MAAEVRTAEAATEMGTAADTRSSPQWPQQPHLSLLFTPPRSTSTKSMFRISEPLIGLAELHRKGVVGRGKRVFTAESKRIEGAIRVGCPF